MTLGNHQNPFTSQQSRMLRWVFCIIHPRMLLTWVTCDSETSESLRSVYAHFSMWDGKNVNNQSQMHTNCLSLNSMYSAYWKYVSILQLLVSPFVFLRFTVECSTILGHHSPIPGDQYERWGYQAARLHLLIRCKQRKDIYYWWFRNPAFTSWGW